MNFFLTSLTKELKSGADMLTKAALAIPQDKREWNPGGKARSTKDILVECAGFPQWITFAVQNKRMPTEVEAQNFQTSITSEAKTVEALTEILNKETDKYIEFVKTIPESRYTEEMTFPWGTFTLAATLGFHSWNNTYHLGQINYLQLILGDTEMHM